MTVPQIHMGIAVILYNVYQCGTPTRMLHEQTRRLQRNELARLYHWTLLLDSRVVEFEDVVY